MTELKNGKWFGLHICDNCKEPLSDTEVTCSNGVCPECGFNSNNTIIKTQIVTIKYVENGGFFFRNGWFEVNEKDDFAVAWLEKFGHQLKYMS